MHLRIKRRIHTALNAFRSIYVDKKNKNAIIYLKKFRRCIKRTKLHRRSSHAGEHLVGCGDPTHRCRRRRHKIFAKIYPTDRSGGYHPPAKSAQNILTRIRRDSPCGCPISAKPIQSFIRPVRTGASPVLATRIESAWCGDKKPLPIPKVSNGTAVKK